MSSTVASKSTVARRAGAILPAYARAAIYGVAWLPAFALIVFTVPKFEDLFSRLRERGELPAVTESLLPFVYLNEALYCLPSLLFLVLLVVADIGVANSLQNSARKRRYWIWFGSVVFLGIVAAAFVTTALLLPVMKMSASI